MSELFDPTTAHGLILIAVVAGLAVALICYGFKKIFRKKPA